VKVAVVGCGYVGLVTAVGLASVGHDVLAVDVDVDRLAALERGKAPFFEPGLDDALAAAIADGRFRVSASLADTADSEVVLLCVQTPPTPSGSVELGFVRAAAEVLAEVFAAGDERQRVVAIRSTVPPGTNDDLASLLARDDATAVVSNPEFLQEGTALEDFVHADRVVLGVREPWARDAMSRLYAPLGAPVVVTSPAAAELAKYASNAFLATLVSFSNEMARLCEATPGVDVEDVLGILHRDRRLRAPDGGSAPASIVSYVKAGCGYGGSCLPKDMAALIAYGRAVGEPLELLSAVVGVNDGQAARLVEIAERELGSLVGRRIAVLGAAFKAGTDDLRDSQGLRVVARLVERGALPVVFDPLVSAERLRAALPESAEAAATLEATLEDVEACLVTTIAPEFRALQTMERIPLVIDGRRDLSPERLARQGYAALGLGPERKAATWS
jgi:UDPglucose 6-dehydrogenase